MTKWKIYQKVLLPDIPPKSEPEENIQEIKKIMKKSHCYMARWTTDFDSKVYKDKNNHKYVLNGTKSLNHDTNVQDYLIRRFNYRKRYCKLHVVYVWYIQILVRFLYPFRKIIYKCKTGLYSKIAVVLRHEEIIESQKKL